MEISEAKLSIFYIIAQHTVVSGIPVKVMAIFTKDMRRTINYPTSMVNFSRIFAYIKTTYIMYLHVRHRFKGHKNFNVARRRLFQPPASTAIDFRLLTSPAANMVLFTLQVHENPLCVRSVTESRVRTRFGSSIYTQVLYHLQRGKCMESGRIRVLCKTDSYR